MAPHRCTQCDIEFTASVRNGARYCSIQCSNEPRRIYTDNAERLRAEHHRRRARKRNGRAERFSDIDVFDRDGWICGICREPVDPKLKFPDHFSASMDHIHPLAKGGSHVIENCQCAHWVCNSRKTDTVFVCEAA